jgi:hypothetical protein
MIWNRSPKEYRTSILRRRNGDGPTALTVPVVHFAAWSTAAAVQVQSTATAATGSAVSLTCATSPLWAACEDPQLTSPHACTMAANTVGRLEVGRIGCRVPWQRAEGPGLSGITLGGAAGL